VAHVQTPIPGSKLRAEFKLRQQPEVFLSTELVPTVLVADLSGPAVADLGYPRQAIGHVSTAAGGAGTNAQCMCVGVGDRGKIYKITRALISKPLAGLVQINLSLGAALGAITLLATKGFQDQRTADVPDMSIGALTPLTAAISGTQVGLIDVQAEEGTVQVDFDVVLGAGGFLNVVNLTANETLRCSFFWTEYLLEDR